MLIFTVGPAITAFACRAWWSRKTTGNKMQRNNARKITGRASGTSKNGRNESEINVLGKTAAVCGISAKSLRIWEKLWATARWENGLCELYVYMHAYMYASDERAFTA